MVSPPPPVAVPGAPDGAETRPLQAVGPVPRDRSAGAARAAWIARRCPLCSLLERVAHPDGGSRPPKPVRIAANDAVSPNPGRALRIVCLSTTGRVRGSVRALGTRGRAGEQFGNAGIGGGLVPTNRRSSPRYGAGEERQKASAGTRLRTGVPDPAIAAVRNATSGGTARPPSWPAFGLLRS